MRKPPSTLLRSLAIASSLAALTSCATTAPPPDSPARLAKASCLNSTGSRIAPARAECLSVPGRSYSSGDIDNTGVIDPAQALRMLDPSVGAGR